MKNSIYYLNKKTKKLNKLLKKIIYKTLKKIIKLNKFYSYINLLNNQKKI